MKKIKLLIVTLLLFAQGTAFGAELDFGLDFGISGSNFKIKDDKSAIDNELGYGIGGSANITLEKINIGAELWYTRNTATLDENYYGSSAKIKSNSLDLPVLVSFSLLKPLKLEAGPSFSLLSNAKIDVGDKTAEIGRIKPNMGYVVGARLVILKILVLGARYNGGFGCQELDLGGTTKKIRSNSYTISVGARL